MRFFQLFIALISLLVLLSTACSVKPKGTYADFIKPLPPDYSKTEHWSALPNKEDTADKVPSNTVKNQQATAKIDVFFLHPTTYIGDKGQSGWNASLNDKACNEKTDNTTILHQASIFNGVGKVYAPRYRQAHIQVYYDKYKAEGKAALALAYEDVKAAFAYYLEHYNNGRPFIIASHSQGTTHAAWLIRDMIEGQALQEQLVAAYLVGMPAPADFFQVLKPCETPEQTGCFCSWRTYREGHFPKDYMENNNLIVTNPISWSLDETLAPKSDHKGAVLYNFDAGFYPNLIEARVHDGLLWTNKPKFPGSIFMTTKNYHIADFNLFYLNVRENAQLRAKHFLEK